MKTLIKNAYLDGGFTVAVSKDGKKFAALHLNDESEKVTYVEMRKSGKTIQDLEPGRYTYKAKYTYLKDEDSWRSRSIDLCECVLLTCVKKVA